MTEIGPDEMLITGRWSISNGHMVGDPDCHRIEQLTQSHLVKVQHDWSGWETLYRDPSDGRFWELTYPQSEMHGGGPPQLRCVSPREASEKYGSMSLPPSGDTEFRAAWRASWLSSIQELADMGMQRSTWLNPQSENRHYSFVEYVEGYFSDLALSKDDGGYPARIADSLLSQEEAAAVSHFHVLFDSYEPRTDRFDHQDILEDPRWHRVVEAAQAAQARLATMIDHPAERENLLLPSVHALAAAGTVD